LVIFSKQNSLNTKRAASLSTGPSSPGNAQFSGHIDRLHERTVAVHMLQGEWMRYRGVLPVLEWVAR